MHPVDTYVGHLLNSFTAPDRARLGRCGGQSEGTFSKLFSRVPIYTVHIHIVERIILANSDVDGTGPACDMCNYTMV